MRWADNNQAKLTLLSELDHDIRLLLKDEEINPEEIGQLVDRREQILQSLLDLIKQSPELAKTSQWQQAIEETQSIVALLQEKTDQVGQALHKYRYGNKSVQQYKKFL